MNSVESSQSNYITIHFINFMMKINLFWLDFLKFYIAFAFLIFHPLFNSKPLLSPTFIICDLRVIMFLTEFCRFKVF